MAKPTETVWRIEAHTKAKHRILRGHLDARLPIMSANNGRLVYIDGFAGPGVYADGEPGSPIIALKSFLEHKYGKRSRLNSYIFLSRRTRIARIDSVVR